MKGSKIKHIVFIWLLAVVCLSFSTYVLTSPFKFRYEVSTSDFPEDDAETSKEFPKELMDIEITAHPMLAFHPTAAKKVLVYHHVQLPVLEIAPLTPPPDLA